MDVPAGFERRDSGRDTVVACAELSDVPIEEFWAAGVPLAGAAGRGAVERLEIAGIDLVVRRYRRGGALRRWLPDLFRSPGRAVRELAVLARLRARGVPVVDPVAALARRNGLMFELRIATRRVTGAYPLPAFVAREPDLRRAAVERAGEAVAAAFDAGLRHPDLHPDNVLAWRAVDAECAVALLDFDRATLAAAPTPPAERDAMLVRMARYLRRHAADLPVSDRAVDHLRFLRGLGLARSERRTAIERLRPVLAAQLRRRGLD